MTKYIPYERRPLAIAGRDCLRICNEVSTRMQPMYKFQLGTSICNIAAKQAVCIYNALNEPMESKNKLSLIDKISELTNYLLVYIRVAKDINQIDLSRFEELITRLISIRKQIDNWKHAVEEAHKKIKKDPYDDFDF